jgi:hypothetical protein
MLRALRTRLQGSLAISLQNEVAGRADSIVSELFGRAFEDWERAGFDRFDDGETSCTVRLFDCVDRILRNDLRKWGLVRVQYDGPQPTPEIRSGRANPNTSPRPDLILSIGRLELNMEAKRVGTHSPLPRDYVERGMARFVTGRYAMTVGQPGHMLGYILNDPPQECVTAINRVIAGSASVVRGQTLVHTVGQPARIRRYVSVHGAGLTLIHLHFDLR